jgi:adenylate cyclase
MRVGDTVGHIVLRRPRTMAVGVGLGLALLASAAQALGAFEFLDRKLLDVYFLARGEQQTPAPIVLVAIDYESLQRVAPRWPWPRSVHARLLRALTAAGASTVGLDILFLEPDPREDSELAAAAAAAGNVVWASSFGRADAHQQFLLIHHREPVSALQVGSSEYGYTDLPFDPDGYVRRVRPFTQFGPVVLKSFAVAVADRYRREPMLDISASGIRWPGRRGRLVAAETDGSLVINFAGPPGSFLIVPYVRVLEGKVPPETFRGRIVLVGAVSGDTDRFFTPYYSRLKVETSQPMAGVEVHANTVNMLLNGTFLRHVEPVWPLLLFIVIGLAGGVLLWRPRLWLSLGVLMAIASSCLALGYQLFASLGLWLPVAGAMASAPLIWGAVAFCVLLAERHQTRFVRSTLERYVSPAVVEEVVGKGIDLALGGQRRTVTVLFSDIQDFTGMSERIPPEVVVDLLNRHFTTASEIILRYGGTLDKFVGDALMAFWGAPVPQEDHALLAVRAALDLQAAARELDARVQHRLQERFRIGVGINTGEAVVGHIGSPRRMGYTAVGDPINLGARVESLTREHEADVIITQFTYEIVKFYVDAEPLGVVHVKGRKEPVAIYRVLTLKPLRSL